MKSAENLPVAAADQRRGKRGSPRPTDTSLAPTGGPRERRRGLRAIGVAVTDLAAPLVRQRGGGMLARLKTDWAAIVGADWAESCWPAALGRDGGLKLRTAPTAALEIQHRAPLLIERINLYFGRALVTRLVLVQGPLPLPPRQRAAPAPRPLRREEEDRLAAGLASVTDPGLRAALLRLGRAVIGTRG
jgi:hypothetical protein